MLSNRRRDPPRQSSNNRPIPPKNNSQLLHNRMKAGQEIHRERETQLRLRLRHCVFSDFYDNTAGSPEAVQLIVTAARQPIEEALRPTRLMSAHDRTRRNVSSMMNR